MDHDTNFRRAVQCPDDLIDFPVNEGWLDFYHAQGLTPRSSGRIRRGPTVAELPRQILLRETDDRPVPLALEMDRLREENERLRRHNGRLQAEVEVLRQKATSAPTFKGIDLDVLAQH